MAESVYRPDIPQGHIFVNDKWKNSDLFSCLKYKVQATIIENMDFVDFYPATDFAVVFITEADVVAGTNYRRNLAKLKKANYEKSSVIVERTPISSQYFSSLQKFAVIELSLGIIPVVDFNECCIALVAMVRMGYENKSNPFMRSGRVPPLEMYLLKTLLTVPSLGETKAQALLLRFKSLINICNASVEDLSKVVGVSSAQQVYDFFHNC